MCAFKSQLLHCKSASDIVISAERYRKSALSFNMKVSILQNYNCFKIIMRP